MILDAFESTITDVRRVQDVNFTEGMEVNWLYRILNAWESLLEDPGSETTKSVFENSRWSSSN